MTAGNNLRVGPHDPTPRYVAKMTSMPKVTDETQVKFHVIMAIASRKSEAAAAESAELGRARPSRGCPEICP